MTDVEAEAQAPEGTGKLTQVLTRAKALPDEQVALADQHGRDQEEALKRLPALDDVTRFRIGPSICEASKMAFAAQRRNAAMVSLLADHKWLRVALDALRFLGMLALLVFVLSRPLVRLGLDNPASTLALYAGTVLCLVGLYLYRRLSRLNIRASAVVAAGTLLGVCIAARAADDRWRRAQPVRQRPSVSATDVAQKSPLAGAEWRDVLTGSLAMLTTLMFLVFLFQAIRSIKNSINSLEGEAVVACATVVHSLLEVALLLEAQTRPRPSILMTFFNGEPNPPQKYSPYMASRERAELVSKLESLAVFLEGPWERRVRLGDEVGDAELRRIAEGIAANVRLWKPIVAVGGDRLSDARDAFTQAVVDAANGQWADLSRELSEEETAGQKILRLGRRAAAIGVFVAVVVLVFLQPFSWTHSLATPAAVVPVMLVATLVAGLLDPTIYERASNAVRVSNDVLSKR